MKRIFCLLGLSIVFSATAQKNLVRYFPAAATGTTPNYNNVQQLVEGYISPITQDFGSLVNNGWYNTAATHKRFGFDFTVTVNTISAKSDAKYFIVPAMNGVVFNGTTGKNDKAPTAYGPEKEYPNFQFTSGPNNNIQFRGPDGGAISKDVPIGSIAVPTLQAGVGLFANTDLRIRYTPTIKINDSKLGNWGLGIHHDIKQHIPGLKELPFSLSLFIAYSQMKATTDLSGVYAGSAKQEGAGETKAYTVQVLVSKKVSIITIYGAVGYNASKTKYTIKGTYNVNETSDGVPLLTPVTLTDPFSLQTDLSGIRATGGLRINMGPVILNGDYSFVNSKGLFTAGLGFTVR